MVRHQLCHESAANVPFWDSVFPHHHLHRTPAWWVINKIIIRLQCAEKSKIKIAEIEDYMEDWLRLKMLNEDQWLLSAKSHLDSVWCFNNIRKG